MRSGLEDVGGGFAAVGGGLNIVGCMVDVAGGLAMWLVVWVVLQVE